MKTIALYSIKGGVGKTAACVNLAHLASLTYPTLLCDLDPQGASTFYFRIKPKENYNSDKFLKGGKKIDKAIRGTDFDKLDLLPAHLSYRNLDIQLSEFSKSRTRLSKLLEELSGQYDMIFMDCPPNLTLVSENVFIAADLIVVPLIPTTLSIMAYKKLLEFFNENNLDRSKLYPFFSMVESRKLMHRQIVTEFLKSKMKVFKTFIPYSAEVEKMGLYLTPLTHKRPEVPASIAFKRLWKEIKSQISLR